LIPVLLFSYALGVRGIDADPIWYDEYFSILDAGGGIFDRRTPLDIWDGVAARNPWHTPGFFIVLSGWGALVGWEPPALRVLSLLVGALAIAWTYRLGRDLISPRAGVIAAALLGLTAFFIYYAHEIRMYTLIAALTAFTVWAYFRLVDLPAPRWWHWLSLFAGAVSLLYMHYFAALPLMAVGLYHLLFVAKNRRWWLISGVLAAAGVLFLPWVNALIAGIGLAVDSERTQERALDNGEILYRVADLYSNGGLPLLVLVGLSSLWQPTRATRRLWFLLVAILGGLLLVNAVLRVIPETRIRYFIALLPVLALTIALGIIQLGRLRLIGRYAAGLTLAAWLLLGVVHSFDPVFLRALGGAQEGLPLQQVARTLDQSAEEVRDDYLLVFESITSENASRFYFRDRVNDWRNVDHYSIDDYATFADFGRFDRVWLAYSPRDVGGLPNEFAGLFLPFFASCQVAADTPDLHVELYGRLPLCCSTPGEMPVASFGDDITLAGVAPLPDPVTDVLPTSLFWELSSRVPPYTYSVGLKVLDSADRVTAELDYGLPLHSNACTQHSIDVSRLAAGTYTLAATVYAWETGGALEGQLAAGGATGTLLPLKTFRIER
jgi:hypothetical protein